MTCTTCNDTRIVNLGDRTMNCPECNIVTDPIGPTRPQPMTVSIPCTSAVISMSDDQLVATLTGVEDLLVSVPIAHAVSYYGLNLLDHIEPGEIRAYLQALPGGNEP